MDLEEGQGVLNPQIPPTSENLRIDVNLWWMLIIHHTSTQLSNAFGQPYLIDTVAMMLLWVMQILWLALFLLLNVK